MKEMIFQYPKNRLLVMNCSLLVPLTIALIALIHSIIKPDKGAFMIFPMLFGTALFGYWYFNYKLITTVSLFESMIEFRSKKRKIATIPLNKIIKVFRNIGDSHTHVRIFSEIHKPIEIQQYFPNEQELLLMLQSLGNQKFEEVDLRNRLNEKYWNKGYDKSARK